MTCPGWGLLVGVVASCLTGGLPHPCLGTTPWVRVGGFFLVREDGGFGYGSERVRGVVVLLLCIASLVEAKRSPASVLTVSGLACCFMVRSVCQPCVDRVMASLAKRLACTVFQPMRRVMRCTRLSALNAASVDVVRSMVPTAAMRSALLTMRALPAVMLGVM